MSENCSIPLTELSENCSATVKEINCEDNFICRIYNMGLRKGSHVKMLRNTKWTNGAIIISIDSLRFGIGHELAKQIKVNIKSPCSVL